MRYFSTRGDEAVALEQAIMSGTAPDGGLFVPAEIPTMVDGVADGEAGAINVLASQMLAPFFDGSYLEDELPAICDEAFNFAVELRAVEDADEYWSLLELFHGPTAAFKDFGARFLAACMSRIVTSPAYARGPATILVATSGDTGGAVAAAFHRQPGIRVIVLYPDGRVSTRQEHQLTCWGDNVTSLAVRGEFDDCQNLVKAAFADRDIARRYNLCSANSINVGRLLPQTVYYAWAALTSRRNHGVDPNFVVPTGNLGNAFACVWARRMGFPVGRLILATNANRTIPAFISSGNWEPRPSIATLASAMDVGNPSNMERLRDLAGGHAEVVQEVEAISADDAQIRRMISDTWERHGVAVCPHTAAGIHAMREAGGPGSRGRDHWIVVATAHPAKFEAIVEPAIGGSVPLPPSLAEILGWDASHDTIAPSLDALRAYL